MPKKILNVGDRFYSLTVVKDMQVMRGGGSVWLFECDCGQQQEIASYRVTNGHQKCCSLCSHDNSQVKATTRLGHTSARTSSPEYSSWQSMKTRCLNPNAANYDLYGGRGIAVCDRWQESFKNFLEDMGERPPGTSLDRIDPNGNYEPSNCRWASSKTQRNNIRNKHRVTMSFKGLDLTIPQWAERLGVTEKTIRNRRSKKQPIEKILREFA